MRSPPDPAVTTSLPSPEYIEVVVEPLSVIRSLFVDPLNLVIPLKLIDDDVSTEMAVPAPVPMMVP